MGLAGALQAEKETKIHINPGRMNYRSLQNGRTHVIKLFLSGWFIFFEELFILPVYPSPAASRSTPIDVPSMPTVHVSQVLQLSW